MKPLNRLDRTKCGTMLLLMRASSLFHLPKPLCLSVLAAGIAFAACNASASVVPPTRPLVQAERASGAGSAGPWSSIIKQASKRFHIAESWIRAVMQKESGGQTMLDGKPITSHAGAMGLMQVMPQTYKDMREQYGLGADPYDPRDNVLAGAAYLKWLHGKYGYPRMFAAYNAGPGTLEANLEGKRSLPEETRNYIGGIGKLLGFTPSASQPKPRVATLTRPDGTSVAIDGAKVDSIRTAMPDEYAPGVKTVVVMGPLHQGLREDLKAVAAALRRKA
jgi:transglycosylase-like protein with SLT domain